MQNYFGYHCKLPQNQRAAEKRDIMTNANDIVTMPTAVKTLAITTAKIVQIKMTIKNRLLQRSQSRCLEYNKG